MTDRAGLRDRNHITARLCRSTCAERDFVDHARQGIIGIYIL
jgi:hypothetical protein